MRRYLTVLALLILCLVPAATAGTAAPLGYIVVLKSGVSTSAIASDQAAGAGTRRRLRLSQRTQWIFGARTSSQRSPR